MLRRWRRPASPASWVRRGLRRRWSGYMSAALVLPRRAGVGEVVVDAAAASGVAVRCGGCSWAEGAAGDRQHVAHDRAGAPEARRGGGGGGGGAADGAVARGDAGGRGGAPGRGEGDPARRGVRRPPREGVRVRAAVPPRHRVRAPRRVLARAAAGGVHAPLLPVAGRGVRAPARGHRAPDGPRHQAAAAEPERRFRRRRRRRGPPRPAPRVAPQRDVVGVRPAVRAAAGPRQGERRGPGAEGPRRRRLRPARPAQLVRPPPMARPLRPAEHPRPLLPPRPPRQPLRHPHHRRAPLICSRRSRHRLHRRLALPAGQRQARRLRHGRRSLGDGVSRDGHGGRADRVGLSPARAAPGRAGSGARRAGPGGWAGPGRDRVRHGLTRLPPRRHQGDAEAAPTGPTPLMGPPGHVGRTRGRVPDPRWHHRDGEHVGHSTRPRRVGRADGVSARAVHREGGGVQCNGFGSQARAVRIGSAELPREEPRHGHGGILACHAVARVRPPPLAGPGTRRRLVGGAKAVVRDGHPAGGDSVASACGVMTCPSYVIRDALYKDYLMVPCTPSVLKKNST
uniref:Uncharacterized protein n=1 Tax=Oryza glumipatula TaxID=40148 RepID=A0A0E0B5L8_9ORYZ